MSLQSSSASRTPTIDSSCLRPGGGMAVTISVAWCSGCASASSPAAPPSRGRWKTSTYVQCHSCSRSRNWYPSRWSREPVWGPGAGRAGRGGPGCPCVCSWAASRARLSGVPAISSGTQISTPRFRMARLMPPCLGFIVRSKRKWGCGCTTRSAPSTIPRSLRTSFPFGSMRGLSRSRTVGLQKLTFSITSQCPASIAVISTESLHPKLPRVPSICSNPPSSSTVSHPAVMGILRSVFPVSTAAVSTSRDLPLSAGPTRMAIIPMWTHRSRFCSGRAWDGRSMVGRPWGLGRVSGIGCGLAYSKPPILMVPGPATRRVGAGSTTSGTPNTSSNTLQTCVRSPSSRMRCRYSTSMNSAG
mmetsp:Transcript_110329/g.191128  ORF Transcript_110329/g.191128 Transcript_110329/m.191128 type:complete len:358 (+) Transcript_110329:540-1613(+)